MSSDFLDPIRAWKVLPGLVRELIACKLIDPELPALQVLRDVLPHNWWVFSSSSGVLDQPGWPLRNDVVLAIRAAREAFGTRAPPELDEVEAWLDDPQAPAPRRRSNVEVLASHFWEPRAPEEHLMQLFEIMVPNATDDDRKLFLSVQSGPPINCVMTSIVESAWHMREGWLAYLAHRYQSESATLNAAFAIRTLVSSCSFHAERIVAWAISMTTKTGGISEPPR